MSFINIKNPKDREIIVKDYINSLKEIREKAENDKSQGMQRALQLEQSFKPIVTATQESASKITEEIKKNRAVNEAKKVDIGKLILLNLQ